MHELGLCEGIVDAVEQRAAGRPVAGVKIRVGVLHRVVDSALDQAFALTTEGTVAEDARLEVVVVPARTICRSCGQATEAEDLPVVCGACGATQLDLDRGDELVLESIELRGPVVQERSSDVSRHSG